MNEKEKIIKLITYVQQRFNKYAKARGGKMGPINIMRDYYNSLQPITKTGVEFFHSGFFKDKGVLIRLEKIVNLVGISFQAGGIKHGVNH